MYRAFLLTLGAVLYWQYRNRESGRMIPQTNELTPKFCSGEFGAQLIEAHQLVEHLHHYYIHHFLCFDDDESVVRATQHVSCEVTEARKGNITQRLNRNRCGLKSTFHPSFIYSNQLDKLVLQLTDKIKEGTAKNCSRKQVEKDIQYYRKCHTNVHHLHEEILCLLRSCGYQVNLEITVFNYCTIH